MMPRYLLLCICAWSCGMIHAWAVDDDDDRKPQPSSSSSPPGGHDEPRSLVLSATTMAAADIGIAPVGHHPLTQEQSVPARVVLDPDSMSQITPMVSGHVGRVLVTIGSQVRKGDPVAEIISVEILDAQSVVLARRAELATAQATLEAARLASRRANAQTLGGLSQADIQHRATDLLVAESSMSSVQAQLMGAQARLRLFGFNQASIDSIGHEEPAASLMLLAPQDGVITDRDAIIGQPVTPDRPLLTIADPSHVVVQASVAESVLRPSLLGSMVSIRISDTQVIPGRITAVASTMDPQTQTVSLSIAPSETSQLHAGAFLQVAIPVVSRPPAQSPLAIPVAAIVHLGASSCVFIATTSSEKGLIFTPRKVVVGPAISGWAAVVSGLIENEQIATTGVVMLKASLLTGSGDDQE